MLVSEPIPFFVSRSIGVCGGDVYVRQVARGNVIFGGGRGWGDAELTRSRPVTAESLGGMARTLDLVPALKGTHVIRTWTGIDGEMPDDIPVIGHSVTAPDLIHAFGFSGHGFQLGPSSARSSPNSSSKAAHPRPSSPSGSAASRAGRVRRARGPGVSSIDLREVAWPLRAKRYDGGQQATLFEQEPARGTPG
jgi:sarcosine oxidase, subunit beta